MGQGKKAVAPCRTSVAAVICCLLQLLLTAGAVSTECYSWAVTYSGFFSATVSTVRGCYNGNGLETTSPRLRAAKWGCPPPAACCPAARLAPDLDPFGFVSLVTTLVELWTALPAGEEGGKPVATHSQHWPPRNCRHPIAHLLLELLDLKRFLRA